MRSFVVPMILIGFSLLGACSGSDGASGAGAGADASTSASSASTSTSSASGAGGQGGGAGVGGAGGSPLACTGTTADCNGKPEDGCEVDLDSDPKHCGSCPNPCSAANGIPLCSAGSCQIVCANGFDDCNFDVSDGCEAHLHDDLQNCGSCANLCATANATPACVNGACQIDQCNAGFDDCNNNPDDGCEAEFAVDPLHCGNCGVVCPAAANAAPACAGGQCGFTCDMLFADCDMNAQNGCEKSVANDVSNCGACNAVCPSGPAAMATCAGGQCGLKCNNNYGDCDGNTQNGCETTLASDVNNCGSCGNQCMAANATSSCVFGACYFLCTGSFKNCDSIDANGCEADTSTDEKNCGGCGKACLANQQCVSSICM